MVHIDPAALRKHPIVGVLIGGATAVFMCFLLVSGMTEARALLRQNAPDLLSLHDIVNLGRIRWVTLSDGQWHCERMITIDRPFGLERWLRGPIETTEVAITGAVEGEILVACFDGTGSCVERAGAPLTGVVGSTEIFTSRGALRRWSRTGERVTVLNVGASPRYALVMLLGLVAIAFCGTVFAGYYLMLMLPPGGRHPAPAHSRDPIQPS